MSVDKICSLEQVVENSGRLCDHKLFSKANPTFCNIAKNYEVAKYEYEVGKVIKSAPAYFVTNSRDSLIYSEIDLKHAITEVVCSRSGETFAMAFKEITNSDCNVVPESCERFQLELGLP